MARKRSGGFRAQLNLNPFALGASVLGGISGVQEGGGLAGFLQGFSNPTGYYLKQRTAKALATPEAKLAIESLYKAGGDPEATQTAIRSLASIVEANGGDPNYALGFAQQALKAGLTLAQTNAANAKALQAQKFQQTIEQLQSGQGGGLGGQVNPATGPAAQAGDRVFNATNLSLSPSGGSISYNSQFLQPPDTAVARGLAAKQLGTSEGAVAAANQLGPAGVPFLAASQGGGAGGVDLRAIYEQGRRDAIQDAATKDVNQANAGLNARIREQSILNQPNAGGPSLREQSAYLGAAGREAADLQGREAAIQPTEAQPSLLERENRAREAAQTLSPEEGKSVAGFETIDTLLKQVDDNYNKGENLGLTGESDTINSVRRKLPSQVGGMTGQESTFKQALTSLRNTELYTKSGAQINEQELKRLLSALPQASDSREVFESGLRRYKQELAAIKEARLKYATTPKGDLTKPNKPTGYIPGQQKTKGYRITSGPLSGAIVDNVTALQELLKKGMVSPEDDYEEVK